MPCAARMPACQYVATVFSGVIPISASFARSSSGDFRVRTGSFSVCSHSPEPDCAVRAAVQAGELDAKRYDSYLRLLRDLRR